MKTKMNSGVVVGEVKSDSSRRKYKIRRNTDGALTCPCLSFRYAEGSLGSASKTCKHITRLQRAA